VRGKEGVVESDKIGKKTFPFSGFLFLFLFNFGGICLVLKIIKLYVGPCGLDLFAICEPNVVEAFKGTVRPDWICTRVVPLESSLKRPSTAMFLIF
jgi:hypothetical protein